MNNLVDTSDPEAVREAYQIESSWNPDAELWEVKATVPTPQQMILPVHPNQGNWQSADQLNEYLSTAYGADIEDAGLGYCGEPLTNVRFSFTGFIGRWDSASGQWASEQDMGFPYSLISGPDGNVTVNGEDYTEQLFADECASATSSGGNLYAEQCSRTIGSSPHHDPGDCNPDNEKQSTLKPRASTVAHDFHWDGKTSQLLPGFYARKVANAEVDGHYYTPGGYLAKSNQMMKGSVSQETNAMDGATGTCGYGFVERSGEFVDLTTKAGAHAPAVCPSAP